MRVIICDDDAGMRDHYAELVKLVAQKKEYSVKLDRYETAEQVMFSMEDKNLPPDIALLDVLMPGANGIDLGTQMRRAGYKGSIIYITRSKEHMLPAFDVGATNYVLKGSEYESDRFERVFIKAAEEVEQRKRKYLLLNGITEYRNVEINSILYFEVSKHSCTVHYDKDESFEFMSSLGKIESKLLAFGFIRIHRSYLVRGAAVERYTYKEAFMKNGDVVPIGRKYQADFKEAMEILTDIDASKTKSCDAE